MKRQDVIDTTGCPTCGVATGVQCKNDEGKGRTRSHVERLYRAQDIEAGKPDRTTGEKNPDPFADRRCPKCYKLLKSPEGMKQHLRDAHYWEQKYRPRKHVAHNADPDDFDLIDDEERWD